MTRCWGISVVLAIADSPGLRMTHLPSTMTVTNRPPTPKPSSSVAADDLPTCSRFFAGAARTTGFLRRAARSSDDAVHHQQAQGFHFTKSSAGSPSRILGGLAIGGDMR